MSYTTTERVREVLETGGDYNGFTNLRWAVDMAEELTSDIVAYRVEKNLVAATTTRLEKIATLLGCHFYQQADKGYTRRRTGQKEGYFQVQVGKGLDSTTYGQSAKLLDNSGWLDGIGKQKLQVITEWLGLPESQQTPYTQRNL